MEYNIRNINNLAFDVIEIHLESIYKLIKNFGCHMYKASEQLSAGIIFTSTSQGALVNGLVPSLNTRTWKMPKPRDKFVSVSVMPLLKLNAIQEALV